MIDRIIAAFNDLKKSRPLVHIIMHQIAANDVANAVLAVGASPIMAEHPAEAAEIVNAADALGVSLGNINENRLAAISNAAVTAKILGKPAVLDCVGVAVSQLRLNLAHDFIKNNAPCIVKGNASEWAALLGLPHQAVGIEAGKGDIVTKNWRDNALTGELAKYAAANKFVAALTGPIDVITDGKSLVALKNGSPRMAQITGTGCIALGLAASFATVAKPLTAASASLAVLGIASEKAGRLMADKNLSGLGSFHVLLLDALSTLDAKTINSLIKIELQ